MPLPAQLEALNLEQMRARHAKNMLRGLFVVPNDRDYHEGPGLSSTRLKALLKSPAHYKAELAELRKPTPAMTLGSALHCAALEPQHYASRFVALPEDAPASGKKRAEIDAEYAAKGLTTLNYEDATTVSRMIASLEKNEVFQRVVRPCVKELAAWAVDPETGVLKKAKADAIHPELTYIADVKTCEDARKEVWRWDAKRYGYGTSAAMYLDVFSQATGQTIDTFVWIAVEKKPPYAVKFYVASRTTLENGHKAFRQGLETFAACEKSGQWPGYEQVFEELDLPI